MQLYDIIIINIYFKLGVQIKVLNFIIYMYSQNYNTLQILKIRNRITENFVLSCKVYASY